jgi:ABC-2 type transport system permease protein
MLRRFSIFAPAALLLVTLLSWRQHSLLMESNRRAQDLAARTWESQPPRFPLQSISVPWIAPVNMSPLALFDPGNGQWLGTAFYLQLGYLARAQDQLGYDYFAAGRQSELNPASLLRFLIPAFALLIAWKHKAAAQRSLIPQIQEMLERVAPSLALSLLLSAILFYDTLGTDGAIRLLLLLSLYLLYSVAAISITAAGFRLFSQPSTAAAVVAFFWLFNASLARPVSLNLASLWVPLPRLEEFLRLLDQETQNGYLGADPRQDRERRYVAEALRDYKVNSIKELPVNLSAILLQREERHQREVYNRRLQELRARFAAQDRTEQFLAFLFPQVAIEIASASLAATDAPSEYYQLAAADSYWDRLVTRVYSDLVQFSGPEGLPKSVGPDYWKQFPRFQSQLPPIPYSTWQTLLPLAALLVWTALALGAWRTRAGGTE